VSGELEITFRHPVAKKSLTYSLAEIEGVFVKQKILVNPIVLGDDARVLVTIAQPLGDDIKCELAPVVFNEMGFRVDSPIFGEGFDTKKDSVIDTNQKVLDRIAFPEMKDDEIAKAKAKKVTPFNGEINALSHIKNINLPSAITPKGSQFDMPTEFVPTPAKPLSPLELKRLVMQSLGRDLEQADIEVISHYEEVFVEDIKAIVAEILAPKTSILKLVNN
jgi:hypothetical protein